MSRDVQSKNGAVSGLCANGGSQGRSCYLCNEQEYSEYGDGKVRMNVVTEAVTAMEDSFNGYRLGSEDRSVDLLSFHRVFAR